MVHHFTDNERAEIAHAVMNLFNEWQVEAVDQVQLLGLPANTRPRAMLKYQKGTPLPDDEEMLERVQHLLAIQQALGTTFPHNPAMGGLWITTPNAMFGERTPLAVMLQGGLNGILQVRRRLECTEVW